MIISDKTILKDYLKFIYPLCLYAFLQQIFGIIDLVNGSFIGADEMAYIVYIDQVMLVLMALANSVAIGISVLVSKNLEKQRYRDSHRIIANSFLILSFVGVAFLILVIIDHQLFLKLILAPNSFYEIPNMYLVLRAINNLFLYINLLILALEKIKGNTNQVFIINVFGILIKVIVSIVIIPNTRVTLNLIGMITLLATFCVFLMSIRLYFKRNNTLRIHFSDLKLDSRIMYQIFRFSMPVFASLCLFNIGKAVVNIQALRYGTAAVGYLGISNRLVGLMVGFSNGIQDGIAILLARYRTISGYKTMYIIKASTILNILIAIVGVTIYIIFFKDIMFFFSKGNVAIANQISTIFILELIGGLFLPVTNMISGVLYGYEKTKYVLIISFFRIIVFRNVVLFIFSFLNIGIAALGLAMLISHLGTFIVSMFVVRFNFKNTFIKWKEENYEKTFISNV